MSTQKDSSTLNQLATRILNDSDSEMNISPIESDDEETTDNFSINTTNRSSQGRRGRGSRAPRASRSRVRGRGQTKLNF